MSIDLYENDDFFVADSFLFALEHLNILYYRSWNEYHSVVESVAYWATKHEA
jgi:hypothetical protein